MASYIARLMSNFQPAQIMTGDTSAYRQVGVVTTALVKEGGRMEVQKHLRQESFLLLADALRSGKSFTKTPYFLVKLLPERSVGEKLAKALPKPITPFW